MKFPITRCTIGAIGSIGCVPCTTPVQIGEDIRAGRWRGTNKTECGIHQQSVNRE